jgi:hypothetical protein
MLFFCYFPNKIHYIQADFSEGKFSCFKCLEARFHETKILVKTFTTGYFLFNICNFLAKFSVNVYFKSETQSCFFVSILCGSLYLS